MSISSDPLGEMVLTDVPPSMIPTLNVALGDVGTWMSADRRDRAAERVDGVRHAERAVAVTAGPLVRDAIPVAADGAARDAEPGAVDGDEVVDLALVLAREQVAHAAQVAGPFFADVADEEDRAGRGDLLHSGTRARRRAPRRGRGSRRRCRGRPCFVPSRFTFTSVPSGNTVSRWPAIMTVGPVPVPRRSAITLPMESMRTFRPSASSRRLYSAARTASLNGGAGISQMDCLLLERPRVVGLDAVERALDTSRSWPARSGRPAERRGPARAMQRGVDCACGAVGSSCLRAVSCCHTQVPRWRSE